MKQIIIMTILCAFFDMSMQAQQTYTLQDCCRLAVENNIKIKTAQMNIESAKQDRLQAFTNYFPTISMAGGAFQADKEMATISLNPEINLNILRKGITSGITATLPIFTGGRIINNNKILKLTEEMAHYKLQQNENEVQLTIEQYYWQSISLQEKLRTIRLIEELTNSIYKDVSNAVEVGVKKKNDLLQIQLRKNIIASNRLQVENCIKISNMIIGQYIGLPSDSFNLKQLSYEELLPPETFKISHENALPNTLNYKLFQKQISIAKLQKKVIFGTYLPSANIGASYMYHNVLGTDRLFSMLTVNISIPISNWWGGSYALRKQKLQIKIAEYNWQNINELQLIQMQKLYDELKEIYIQVEVSKNSIKVAAENVRLNKDFYDEGTSTLTDLLNAQSLLQESYNSFTDNYTQYLMKITEYLQATGR